MEGREGGGGGGAVSQPSETVETQGNSSVLAPKLHVPLQITKRRHVKKARNM